VHGLLAGRQAVLLRNGGIHEVRFAVPDARAEPFLLFSAWPTRTPSGSGSTPTRCRRVGTTSPRSRGLTGHPAVSPRSGTMIAGAVVRWCVGRRRGRLQSGFA
jgi:hypothetical protein